MSLNVTLKNVAPRDTQAGCAPDCPSCSQSKTMLRTAFYRQRPSSNSVGDVTASEHRAEPTPLTDMSQGEADEIKDTVTKACFHLHKVSYLRFGVMAKVDQPCLEPERLEWCSGRPGAEQDGPVAKFLLLGLELGRVGWSRNSSWCSSIRVGETRQQCWYRGCAICSPRSFAKARDMRLIGVSRQLADRPTCCFCCCFPVVFSGSSSQRRSGPYGPTRLASTSPPSRRR